jgi:hypothetical protein
VVTRTSRPPSLNHRKTCVGRQNRVQWHEIPSAFSDPAGGPPESSVTAGGADPPRYPGDCGERESGPPRDWWLFLPLRGWSDVRAKEGLELGTADVSRGPITYPREPAVCDHSSIRTSDYELDGVSKIRWRPGSYDCLPRFSATQADNVPQHSRWGVRLGEPYPTFDRRTHVAHPMGGMTARLSRLPSHPAAQGEASRMWTVPCVRSPDRQYRTDARSRRSWPHRPLRSLGHHLSRGHRGTPVPLPRLPESNPYSTQAWSRPYRVPLSRAVRRLISRATSSPCMSPWPSASDSSLSVREWSPSPSTSRSSRERGLAGNSDPDIATALVTAV